jgi:hypothetical protein
MGKVVIIVQESVSRDDVAYVGYKHLWMPSNIVKASNETLQEITYQIQGGKSLVRYIIEQRNHYPYLIVEGEAIEATVRAIHSSLPLYSREEIIRMVQAPKSDEEYIRGILYLGLEGKFKECDVETLDLLKQALQSKYSETRTNAIIAMSYAGWPEFRDLVHPFSKNDPDDRVRETAARFLEGSELP